MVTTMSTVSTIQGAAPLVSEMMVWAIRAVPPDDSSALPMGMSEPSSTITGHSIDV